MFDPSLRENVRRRAQFACEFCGIHENDAGGELTIEHYQPKGKGGDDSLDNLIYCCFRCNQHKLDYWPALPDQPSLWNPRRELASHHCQQNTFTGKLTEAILDQIFRRVRELLL